MIAAVPLEPAPLVLAVDDEPLLLRVLSRMLEGAGYRVLTAASAMEALDLLVSSQPAPDLVVSDVRMDPVDGGSLAILIRHLWPEVPVMLMSGYAGSVDFAGPFLSKPFTAEQLLAAVEALVRSPRRAGARKLV
jgi:CheY-like chemotaxis protein